MNRVTKLFKIKYPIIQGGMVWCSGWKLASSVSNSGGLGIIGSGSMRPLVLKEHIKKCKEAGVNELIVVDFNCIQKTQKILIFVLVILHVFSICSAIIVYEE